jgi:hypothetical protein
VLCTRDIYFFLDRLQEQGCFVLKRFYRQRFGFFRNFKIKGGRKLLKTYILEIVVPPALPSLSVSVIESLMSAFGFGSSSVPFGSLVVPSIAKLNELSKDMSISVSCLSDESIVKLNELSNTCSGGITCVVEETITSQ